MSSAYTPAGWHVDYDGELIVAEDGRLVADVAPWRLTKKEQRHFSEEETKANSQLIAAAPEMAEALKVVINGAALVPGEGFRYFRIPESHLRCATEALAKAVFLVKEGD